MKRPGENIVEILGVSSLKSRLFKTLNSYPKSINILKYPTESQLSPWTLSPRKRCINFPIRVQKSLRKSILILIRSATKLCTWTCGCMSTRRHHRFAPRVHSRSSCRDPFVTRRSTIENRFHSRQHAQFQSLDRRSLVYRADK